MTACARRRPSGREGTRAGSAAVAVSTARDGRDGRTDGRTTRGAGRDRVAPPSRDPPASWPPWCPRGPVSSLLEERRFFRLSGSRTRRGVTKPRASPSRSSRVRPRARDRALLAREQTGGPSRGDLRSRAARCVHDGRAGAGTNDPRATGYSRDRRHRSIEATARSRSGVRSSGRVRARGDARVPRTTRRAGSTARRVTAREVTARGNPRRASDAHGEERGDGERRARGKSSKSNPPGGALASHSDAMLKKQQQAVGGFVHAAPKKKKVLKELTPEEDAELRVRLSAPEEARAAIARSRLASPQPALASSSKRLDSIQFITTARPRLIDRRPPDPARRKRSTCSTRTAAGRSTCASSRWRCARSGSRLAPRTSRRS